MSAPNPTEKQELPFGTIASKRTSVVFDQPDVSSDGGAILIKHQADKTDLFAKLAGAIHDGRKQPQVVHAIETLVAQRVTGLCLGYEDANDWPLTRRDFMMKIACDIDPQRRSAWLPAKHVTLGECDQQDRLHALGLCPG
jgi:hypothetical protein